MWRLHRHTIQSQYYCVVLMLLSGGLILLASMTGSWTQASTPPELTQFQLQLELWKTLYGKIASLEPSFEIKETQHACPDDQHEP